MKFEYTGRHVEVSPGIRKHVEDHFKKLDHIFNGTEAQRTSSSQSKKTGTSASW